MINIIKLLILQEQQFNLKTAIELSMKLIRISLLALVLAHSANSCLAEDSEKYAQDAWRNYKNALCWGVTAIMSAYCLKSLINAEKGLVVEYLRNINNDRISTRIIEPAINHLHKAGAFCVITLGITSVAAIMYGIKATYNVYKAQKK